MRTAEGWRTAAWLSLPVSLSFALRWWLISADRVPTLYDQSVHLYLMRMLARREGRLYEDAFFVHPPAMIWLGAWLWRMTEGNLSAMRLIHAGVASAGILPFLLVAHRAFGRRVVVAAAWLLSLTPAWSGWLGANLYLEQPLAILVSAAVGLAIIATSNRTRAVAGLGLGVAMLVKLTAVPVAVAATAGLALASLRAPCRDGLRTGFPLDAWKWLAAGCAAGWSLSALVLFSLPGAISCTLFAPAAVPWRLQGRLCELTGALLHLPVALVIGGLAAVAATRSLNPRERACGYTVLLLVPALAVVPATFYWRHLAVALPLLSVLAAASCSTRIGTKQRAGRVIVCSVLGSVQLGTLAFGLIGPGAAHQRHDDDAVSALRHAPEPVFTLRPIWLIVGDRQAVPWRFASDPAFALDNHRVPPQDMLGVVRQSRTIVATDEDRRWLPPAVARMVSREYAPAFVRHGAERHERMEIWLRRTAIRSTPSP